LDDEAGGRELAMLKWGLVPFWAKEGKSPGSMINARAEGIADKPAYREAMRKRRCLVPVSGFYEWMKVGAGKQPHYITSAGGEPLVFAGLWEWWRPKAEPGSEADARPTLETFTVITTTPNEMMEKIHDRMPVILDPADFDRWMDPAVEDPARVVDLLKPYPAELMVATPVSTRVNSPKNDDAECVRPLERETLF
jgi:putative SOS response-associated peptidase YedK